MDSRSLNLDSGRIVYDADLFPEADTEPNASWFEPQWWEKEDRVIARPQGRGTALVVETPVGRAVLREYLRGGWVAKFVRSRYLFTGYGRSRPFREFRVLEKLAELGLPAPEPVAGLCRRHGISCSGALITLEIENVRPLVERLEDMDEAAWKAVGACIRNFHDRGLVHADLTVRNILIQDGGDVFLVDFDQARFNEGATRAFRRNLERLQRSLRKAWLEDDLDMDELAWTHLLKGYES